MIDKDGRSADTPRVLPTVGGEEVNADEWDVLTTALNRWGVVHVAPGRRRRIGVPRAPSDLFERLFVSSEPRLQQSAIVLLLTHPRLSSDARAAIDRLVGPSRDRAMRRYVAAAALQTMARTRIELCLGPQLGIPPAYVDALGLPPLDEEFGREALLELADQEQARYGYNAWGTYRGVLDLFLSEIRRQGWGATCGSARIRPA